MKGFRGPKSRPQANTGDPKVDRALRELGEPTELRPRLFYDKTGRLDLSPAFQKRVADIEKVLASLGVDNESLATALRAEVSARKSGGTGSGGALDDLSDVDTSGVSISDVLTFDGTDWVPGASGSMSAAAILAALLTVDGSGSGLDADTLDGFPHRGVGGSAEHPDAGATSGFMTAAMVTKLAGIETGATADLTAAEILALLVTVDGSGSGLDADTIDGFAHRGVGGTAEHPNGTIATAGFISIADKSKLDGIEAGATADQTAAEILAALLTVDGSGSGLDADTIDGAAPVTAIDHLSDVTITGLANRDVLQYDSAATQWKNVTTATLVATFGTLAVNKGGTGQVTAQAAIDALSAVSAATNEHVLTKDTASGNAIFKVATVPNDAITYAKMQDVTAASRVIGRGSAAGSGDPQELTLGAGMSMVGTVLTGYTHPNHSGDVTSVADGAQTIVANAVTNAKLADMANATIKGRTTAGTGDPEDLTAAQARAILGLDTVDVQTFTSAGAFSWSKPTSFTPKAVRVILYGGGGGGGGGSSNTGAVVRTGGCGGGGGSRAERTYLASDLGNSVAGVVGAGGLSGTAGASGADGGVGGAGGTSTFSTGITLLSAFGGGGGALGDNAASAGAGGGGGGIGSVGTTGTTAAGTGGGPGFPSQPSGGCGATGTANSASSGQAEYGGGGGGGHTNVPANGLGGGSLFGGGGGGVGAGSTNPAGLIAATAGGSDAAGGGGAAGTSGAVPTAGTAGTPGNAYRGGYGGGGGGGTISANTAGMVGGAGAAPAGGGGGGGIGCNTGIGGAGGVGGLGAAYIISW